MMVGVCALRSAAPARTTLGLAGGRARSCSVAFERPPAVTWGCAATVAVTAVKRLEANRAPLAAQW